MVPGMGSAIGGSISGLTSIASGIIGSKKRKAEERAAKAEFASAKQRMAGFDTSNLYANQENAYEDLTVNTQAADFQAQQNQATQANIMGNMAGAAGGSGIAALAQTMANQGAQQAQQASASIGQQEAANQAKQAQGAMALQQSELAGAGDARQMQLDKQSFLFDQSSQRLGAAKAARAQATEAIYSGVSQMGEAAGEGLDAMAMASDRKLKNNIKLIGYSPSGLKIYAFEYINKKFGKYIYQGVMSDEVPQYAVIRHKDGYDMVNYSKLDVEFKQI
jgi:hypothetical protein